MNLVDFSPLGSCHLLNQKLGNLENKNFMCHQILVNVGVNN